MSEITAEFETTINRPPRLVIMCVTAQHATIVKPSIHTHYAIIDDQDELRTEFDKFVDDLRRAGYTPINSLFTVVDPETVRKLCKRFQPAAEVTE